MLNFHCPHVELQDGTTIENDLLGFFVCQGIRAQGACSCLVKERAAFQKTEKSKNLSGKLDCGILVDYAYENGFVGNFSRPTVELAISKVINGPLQTAAPPQLMFAMKCPGPEVLRGLYRLSLEAEEWAQQVMEGTGRTTYVEGGEVLSAEQWRDFDLSWNRTLEEGKLCSIDAAETMKNKKWKQFFRQNFA